MEDVFQETIIKSNELIKLIEEDLDITRHQAHNALRVVLHTLRDRLPLEESVHFSAQMPSLVRGMYFEGWKPLDTPVKYNRAEFLAHVARNLSGAVETDVEDVVKVVLHAVFMEVDPNESDKIKKVLPKDVASLLG